MTGNADRNLPWYHENAYFKVDFLTEYNLNFSAKKIEPLSKIILSIVPYFCIVNGYITNIRKEIKRAYFIIMTCMLLLFDTDLSE